MAPTQAALYDELASDDLQLSWSEAELPERERDRLARRADGGRHPADESHEQREHEACEEQGRRDLKREREM